MKKIKQKEAIKSTTMFLLDDTFEKEIDELVKGQVMKYQNAMIGIGTEDGLRKFIVNSKDSIEMLETVLGISGERMKRVVTMIRVSKGYTFDTEWNETKLQKELAANEELLSEYCELFIRGRELENYKMIIPKFILDDFFINADVVSRITNVDILSKLFKKKIEAKYTSHYASYYQNSIKKEVNGLLSSLGLCLETGSIAGVGKNLQYITDGEKFIIITCSYSLTTSANQTKYSEAIQTIYQSIQNKDNVILINMLDGAGWVGRSADFKKVYNDCNYYTNLRKVDMIKQIVKEFFNIQ